MIMGRNVVCNNPVSDKFVFGGLVCTDTRSVWAT